MNPRNNDFKRRLQDGQQQIGMFATFADTSLLELLAGRGFDWILIDTEHAPTDVGGVLDRLRVLDAVHTEAIVRPAWSDPILVKRLLDVGVRSLLFPSINTATEAELAVASTRYPPYGIRGVSSQTRAATYGRDPEYLDSAADQICVVVQIETAEGLRNLEAIAATDGVDAVFIGPTDLAASLGHLGNSAHPDVQEAVNAAFTQLRRANVPSGYLTLRIDEARQRAEEGVAMVGVASDAFLVHLGVDLLEAKLGTSVRSVG